MGSEEDGGDDAALSLSFFFLFVEGKKGDLVGRSWMTTSLAVAGSSSVPSTAASSSSASTSLEAILLCFPFDRLGCCFFLVFGRPSSIRSSSSDPPSALAAGDGTLFLFFPSVGLCFAFSFRGVAFSEEEDGNSSLSQGDSRRLVGFRARFR